MIDATTDKLLSFADAAETIRTENRLAPSTLWRWAHVGVRGHRLETIRIGSTHYTTADCLKSFIAKMSGQVEAPPSPSRKARAARAMQELESLGV